MRLHSTLTVYHLQGLTLSKGACTHLLAGSVILTAALAIPFSFLTTLLQCMSCRTVGPGSKEIDKLAVCTVVQLRLLLQVIGVLNIFLQYRRRAAYMLKVI
jgi:hypothetical protein